MIDELKIVWPASGITQVFKDIKPNQVLKITEDKDQPEIMNVKPIRLKGAGPAPVAPAAQQHQHHMN